MVRNDERCTWVEDPSTPARGLGLSICRSATFHSIPKTIPPHHPPIILKTIHLHHPPDHPQDHSPPSPPRSPPRPSISIMVSIIPKIIPRSSPVPSPPSIPPIHALPPSSLPPFPTHPLPHSPPRMLPRSPAKPFPHHPSSINHPKIVLEQSFRNKITITNGGRLKLDIRLLLLEWRRGFALTSSGVLLPALWMHRGLRRSTCKLQTRSRTSCLAVRTYPSLYCFLRVHS